MTRNLERIDERGFDGEAAHIAYRSLILAQPGVTHFALCHYRPPPSLQERCSLGLHEKEMVRQALERRSDGVTPFWHALFASCLHAHWCSDRLVHAGLFHSGAGQVELYPVSRLRSGSLADLFDNVKEGVGLSSRLQCADGRTSHLALLDFRCEVIPANTELLEVVCSRLYEGGFMLVDSGDSYHACGLTPLSDDERVTFLGRSLLLGPIVDTVYIGHQLQQPFSTIRISRGGARLKTPRVIAIHPTSRP